MEVAATGISRAEKEYLQDGIAANCREDGRTNLELRPIQIKRDVLPTEFGSVRVTNGESDVTVGLRAELVSPSAAAPTSGNIFINVSFSSPSEINRKLSIIGEDHAVYGAKLGAILKSMMFNENVYSPKLLCVKPGAFVWHIYIDLLIQSIGGSLLDIASIGIAGTWRTARLPAIEFVADMGGMSAVLQEELALSSGMVRFRIDPSGAKTEIPGARSVPLVVSLGIIGNSVVADLTQEESYAVSHIVCAAISQEGDNYQICGLTKTGGYPLAIQILSSINLRLLNIGKTTFSTVLLNI